MLNYKLYAADHSKDELKLDGNSQFQPKIKLKVNGTNNGILYVVIHENSMSQHLCIITFLNHPAAENVTWLQLGKTTKHDTDHIIF